MTKTFKHREYSSIDHLEQDMSGLFKVLQLKVKRNKRGLLVSTETHSYQLEVDNGNATGKF